MCTYPTGWSCPVCKFGVFVKVLKLLIRQVQPDLAILGWDSSVPIMMRFQQHDQQNGYGSWRSKS